MSVDPCTRENGLTGYFMIRSVGCYKTTFDGAELFDEALIPPDPDVPEFIPRPVEVQFIKPWTAEQVARFAVPPGKKSDAKRRQQRKRKQAPSMDPLEGLDDLDS
jgi:hypothetical protein